MEYAIETRNLTKRYRGRWFRLRAVPAADQISLQVPKGSVFGFLGPNGAGKTTTIRCLMGLVQPTSGEAFVLGHPAFETAVRQRIGFLPDSPSFATHLTALEFLHLCGRLLKIDGSARRQRVEEVLDLVEMAPSAKERLAGFSRGMLQRIGIAQAILNKPELLILDEPLLGLDPLGRETLKNIIRREQEQGATVFLCSHILSDVEKMCDSVGILNKGRLLAAGRLDELLSKRGLSVLVPKNEEQVVHLLLPICETSRRQDDGSYTFDIAENQTTKVQEMAATFPSSIQVRPHLESLEDYFFRKISVT